MVGTHVEYVGFTANGATREYTLRLRQAEGEARDFTVAIPNEAFLAHRVRYQDAPEICYLKLQREIVAGEGVLPTAHLRVTDSDLEEYRTAHLPRPPQRRPKPPLVGT